MSDRQKKNSRIVDFAFLADHKVKLKERKMRDRYQELAREIEKKWNKKVPVIQIEIMHLGQS